MKKIILVTIVILSSSCNTYEKDYCHMKPYIDVEKENRIYDMTPSEYIENYNNGESFIVLFYSPNCSSCKNFENKRLSLYLNETNNKIYRINVFEKYEGTQVKDLISYQKKGSSFLYLINDKLNAKIPVIEIVYNYEVIDYYIGDSDSAIKMLYAYIK